MSDAGFLMALNSDGNRMVTQAALAVDYLRIIHKEVCTVIVLTMLPSSFPSQNRNSLLNLTTKPRFRRSQPRSGCKPPVTSWSSV